MASDNEKERARRRAERLLLLSLHLADEALRELEETGERSRHPELPPVFPFPLRAYVSEVGRAARTHFLLGPAGDPCPLCEGKGVL